MTKFESLQNIDKLSGFIVMFNKGYTICGLCNADRKICNAEINKNCVRQYLDKEINTDFTCVYRK